MKHLKDLILEKGFVRSEHILDVSQFLNQQVDPQLMQSLGKNFAEYYKDYDFDAFVTVETSGIAPSVFAALHANKPLIIIKKQNKLMDEAVYVQQTCVSFTKEVNYHLTVKKEFIQGKRLILLDDFLAQGSVVKNVELLFNKENAQLLSTGICISKNFQPGYLSLTEEGYDLYTQVQLKSLNPVTGKIEFVD